MWRRGGRAGLSFYVSLAYEGLIRMRCLSFEFRLSTDRHFNRSALCGFGLCSVLRESLVSVHHTCYDDQSRCS